MRLWQRKQKRRNLEDNRRYFTRKKGAVRRNFVIFCMVASIPICLMYCLTQWQAENRRESVRRIRIDNALRFYVIRAREYRKATGRFPNTFLELITGRDENGKIMFDGWNEERYAFWSLNLANVRADKDPWGRPYRYELIKGRPFGICFGKDGVAGGTGADSDVIWTLVDEDVVSLGSYPTP